MGEFRPLSNLLSLADFFRGMPEHAVLKLSEHFPSYHDYSDIDILCADRLAVLAHLEQVGQSYLRRDFTIRREEHDGHLHLDFYAPGAKRLNFRFDLLNSFEGYRKFTVTPDFASTVLAGRIKKVQHEAEVYVPAVTHDLALRFLEFVEWKEERPDKVKHWEFIERTGNFEFVEVVSRFTDLDVHLTDELGSVKVMWSRRLKGARNADGAVDQIAPVDSHLKSFLAQAEQDFVGERYADAAEQFCAALEIDPNQTSILLHLGECLEALRDRASAHWCFERVSLLEPANAGAAEALRRLGAMHDAGPVDLACGSSAS